MSRQGIVTVLSSEYHILKVCEQGNKNFVIFIHFYIYLFIIYVHTLIENLLYAILITGFIAKSNSKILLTWSLQCSEGECIINMQKINSATSGHIQENRGLRRC